ncbi:MAG: TIR domain-containing protein [Solirubrobacteraceae bacterium]|nr:TIR domain-containing protein [Solirubrobacteraceae bacterium]
MYQGQVRRLSDDIAGLRRKVADERKRLADANGKTMRAVQSLDRASSVTQLSSAGRDLERCQKAAAGHESKIADLEKALTKKERDRDSAQKNLDRALAEQQKRDEREAAKRRADAERRHKEDLARVRELEQAQRSAAALPAALFARPARESGTASGTTDRSRVEVAYDVCLSFAGEQRDYVEMVAGQLKAAGLTVFYDQDEEIAATMWGKDLGEFLDQIYREASRFCLMFISEAYAAKSWTRHERRSALARALEQDEYVLPARFDDTELPGLRPTVAYLDLREVAPATLVRFVVEKLRTAG